MSEIPVPDNWPLLPPPPGVESNFDNPEDISHQLIITISIGLGLVVASLACRVYTRLVIKRNWGLDDWMAVVATITTIASCAFMLVQVAIGFTGRHIWDIRMADMNSNVAITGFCMTLVRSLSALFTKLAVFGLYIRLFGVTHPYVRWLSYIGIFVTTTYTTANVATNIALCKPEPGPWGILTNGPKCLISSRTNVLVWYGFNVVLDLYLLALPIQPVRKLKVSRRIKAGIHLIFFMGSLACVCAVVGYVYFALRSQSSDIPWDWVPIQVTAVAETCLGITCCCVPFIADVLRNFRGSRVHSYVSNRLPSSFRDFHISFLPTHRTAASRHSVPLPSSSDTIRRSDDQPPGVGSRSENSDGEKALNVAETEKDSAA